MPELGQQEDSFLEKLYQYIEEEFRKEKETYLQNQEKRKLNEKLEDEFATWRKQIRKEMIELNEKNQLDDFEQYFGHKIEQLKTEFIEKNQA